MIHETDTTETTRGEYAHVNSVNMYYETFGGQGQPLILLHGGLGGIDMFGPALTALAENHRVIGVELQGHGHTADIDRPFSFQQMADDIAALIEHLGLGRIDLMGYSLGGGVALQTTIRHPRLVRKLVVVSTPFRSNNWYPEIRTAMHTMNAQAAEAMVGSPMHQAYVGVAPQPENWATLVTKTGQLISQDYDWSQDVSAIKTPTMIVVGDADSIRTADAVEFFELLGGGQKDAGWDGSGMPTARLAILPGTTHYDIFTSSLLASVAASFLDALITNP